MTWIVVGSLAAAAICVIVVAHVLPHVDGTAPADPAALTSSADAVPSTPTPTPTPTLVPPTVLAIGDSVMKGYGVPDGDSWLRLLAQKQGWNLVDRTCNGAGFIHVAVADCHVSFATIVEEAKADDPDYVIISGSANDFGTNNDQLAEVTDSAIAELRAQFPRATIIGLNVAWGDRTPPGKVAVINAQIASAMQQVHGVYVDFGTPLFARPDLMQADHLHPLATGQLALEAAIEAALAQDGVVIS